MAEKDVKDFYLMHYTYFSQDGSEKGEGNCYVAVPHHHGIRKADLKGAIDQITVGLNNSSVSGSVVVVSTMISYLASCTEEEFNAE